MENGENKIKIGNSSLFPHGCHLSKAEKIKKHKPIHERKCNNLLSKFFFLYIIIDMQKTITKKCKVFDALVSYNEKWIK